MPTEEIDMQTQPSPLPGHPQLMEQRQARAASADEDVFAGGGVAGGPPKQGWLRRPWQTVGQLWRRQDERH